MFSGSLRAKELLNKGLECKCFGMKMCVPEARKGAKQTELNNETLGIKRKKKKKSLNIESMKIQSIASRRFFYAGKKKS